VHAFADPASSDGAESAATIVLGGGSIPHGRP